MKLHVLLSTAVLMAVVGAGPAVADQRTELLEIKNTIVNLVDALVEQGVLPAEKAAQIKAEAAARAHVEAAQESTIEEPVADAAGDVAAQAPAKVVRVPYVPQFVKDEIRDQVREELRKDVTEDVVAVAKEERWGVKDALPAWVTAMNWYGDVRFRYTPDFYSSANVPNSIPNFEAINEAGGITPAGLDAFRNSTEDRHRLRVRARLGFDVTVADKVNAGVRLVTGALDNPISLNETLGRAGDPYEFNLDRAWIRWDEDTREGINWLRVEGGRLQNPYFHASDIIFDNDLGFEGVAATLRGVLPFFESMAGPASAARTAFLTFGAFPLEENELPVPDESSNDKWLWGAQAGVDFPFTETSAATLAFAFYDYINVAGRRNSFNSRLNDWTAPRGLVKGNTVFDIRNDLDLSTELFALAADFTLVNLTAQYRYSGFDPVNVWLTGDIVKNIGYDEQDVLQRTGVRVPERSLGYWVGLLVGTACDSVDHFQHCIRRPGEWTLFGGYRYLQRDAVIDAFTDSNFYLGGTNTEGFQLGLDYGLTKNVWMRTRYMSGDEIDGPPLGIDVLQVDVNAQF